MSPTTYPSQKLPTMYKKRLLQVSSMTEVHPQDEEDYKVVYVSQTHIQAGQGQSWKGICSLYL